MSLNDVAIRAAKPSPKPIKLFDERGLFLLVQPSGGKLWRLKYRIAGKEKKLSLGCYPDVALKEADALWLRIIYGADGFRYSVIWSLSSYGIGSGCRLAARLTRHSAI